MVKDGEVSQSDLVSDVRHFTLLHPSQISYFRKEKNRGFNSELQSQYTIFYPFDNCYFLHINMLSKQRSIV